MSVAKRCERRVAGFLRRQTLLLTTSIALSALSLHTAMPVRAEPTSATYTLAPGDRVIVTVLGQPELSGELPVDSAGDIPLPLIGSLPVEGLTTTRAEQLIRSRLADGYLVSPTVSVRLGEPRPIYVLGSVRSAGAYPFRFGTVVQAAIAAAGGYFAVSDPLQRQVVAESLAAEERLQQLVLEKAGLLVRQARLEAEIHGLESFPVPATPEPLPEDQLAQLVEAEKHTLKSNLRLVKEKVDLIQEQKPRVYSQIDAIKSETAGVAKRLALLRGEFDRSNALVQQGIGTRTTAIQNKLAEATEETNLWRLKGEAFRLERELGELDLRTQEEQSLMRRKDIDDLRVVRSRLAELEVLLPAARAQRDWKLQQAGLADPKGRYRITITRVRAGAAKVLAADEMTLVEPGDLIEVKPATPNAGAGLYSMLRRPPVPTTGRARPPTPGGAEDRR